MTHACLNLTTARASRPIQRYDPPPHPNRRRSLLTTTAAQASFCDKVVTAPIRFAHGAACWTYAGPANRFTGKFKAGQRITVRAIVERHEDSVRTDLDDAQLSISGPGVVFEGNDGPNEQLKHFTKKAGTYEISIGPCAAWGNEVIIKVCATK